MPYFPRKNPLVFPVSPGGTKRLRYPTGCDSSMVSGAPAAAVQHTAGHMSLIPYYIPANVSSVDIAIQHILPGGTAGTMFVGIYNANQGLESAYLTESTSLVCTSSTTSGTVSTFPLAQNYSEGWYIVSGIKTTGGSSAHTNGYVRQAHIIGKPPTYPSTGIDMFYLSTNSVYINTQTSGLQQTIGSALSSGTFIATSSNVAAPIPFLAY
jgi:hypothetical protein